MFNDKTKKNLDEYAVTSDEVELITGIDFYHNMTQQQQNKYESQCAPQKWGL